jgi:hypothetical protein
VSYATLDELRGALGKGPQYSPAYIAKMIHDLPEAETVDRAVFLLQKAAGKRVLEFGASGPMHDAIVKAAADVLGVDRDMGPGVIGFDLDDVSQYALPGHEPEVIICGEVIEHLSNPGWFLTRLKRQFPGVPVVITVPNAFHPQRKLKDGIEMVNRDHVAWYSPKTLRTLVERVGYRITEFAYYNGDGPTSEGLIAVIE